LFDTVLQTTLSKSYDKYRVAQRHNSTSLRIHFVIEFLCLFQRDAEDEGDIMQIHTEGVTRAGCHPRQPLEAQLESLAIQLVNFEA
jgi:ATP-dependent Clp protease adapter protein ClpS